MTCEYCVAKGGTYNLTCPECVARFCLTLPKDSAKRTAEKLCSENGHDIEEVRAIAARIKADRLQKAIMEGMDAQHER